MTRAWAAIVLVLLLATSSKSASGALGGVQGAPPERDRPGAERSGASGSPRAKALGGVQGAPPVRVQDSHLLVVVGLGGEAESGTTFHKWASALVDAARDRHGLAEDSIVYLGEDPARDLTRIDGRASRESVEAAVDRLAAKAGPGDRVFIVLIGHGSSASGEARFNLPGPDLTAKDFARLLDRFAAQTVAFVNTASASGGFVAALSGRDRAIVTATKTDAERNQTRFGEFFAEALGGAEGDLDKDGRVSLLEAFAFARQKVVQSYEKDGQLLTEHAVLDDNGDRQGSDEPGRPGADGTLARSMFVAADPASRRAEAAAAADPALGALYEARRAIEHRVAALKAAKDRMEPARYAQELEQLLVELARKSREIRDREKK